MTRVSTDKNIQIDYNDRCEDPRVQENTYPALLRTNEVPGRGTFSPPASQIDWTDAAISTLALSSFFLSPGPKVVADLIRNILIMQKLAPEEELPIQFLNGACLNIAEMGSVLSKGRPFSFVSLCCIGIRSFRFAQITALEASKISKDIQNVAKDPSSSLPNLALRTFNVFFQSYKTLFT